MVKDRRWLIYALFGALAAASLVLAYFAVQSARQASRLAEQSVLTSTVALVDEKVDRIEQILIGADEAAFHLVNPARTEALSDTDAIQELLSRVAPSVKILVVVGEDAMTPLAVVSRSPTDAAVLLRRLRGDLGVTLDLRHAVPNVLRHVHLDTQGGRGTLLSAKAMDTPGMRVYAILVHDTDYLVEQLLPEVCSDGDVSYAVVDNSERRVFGQDLRDAGDYVVSRRFPSTLYGWRLQLAPKQAQRLSSRNADSARSEWILISFALTALLAGLAFAAYAVAKEGRLNSLRQEFVANVTHELKTPLSVIRMYADLLASGRVKDADKGKQYLEVISKETERLGGLIENVLDFAAIEQGKQTYDFQKHDLLEVLRRALDTARSRIDNDAVKIVFTTDLSQAHARMDEQSLLLVVLNLLENAAKYGTRQFRAPRTVTASSERTPLSERAHSADADTIEVTVEAGRRHYYVKVRDHGPGIPSELHRKVFERFFRVRDENNTARGSGIGLSLVKRIVEAHRGNAWVEDAPDGGAVVAFSVPRWLEVGER